MPNTCIKQIRMVSRPAGAATINTVVINQTPRKLTANEWTLVGMDDLINDGCIVHYDDKSSAAIDECDEPSLSFYRHYAPMVEYVDEVDDRLTAIANGHNRVIPFSASTSVSISNTTVLARPSVTVVDSGGTIVECEVQYIDNDNIKLLFDVPMSGTCYLS